ncbi:nucleotidyltransferase [Paenibacillus agaridevorans]|uniref:Nucleotidyltransferase n=1 Tax=Paenibacillus agaridevorans TaxID=171404 RepID=A0A2R5EJD4_9BACL|nr:nucleotidyltransferase [Paenibacillus agaridevorans]GBG06195.1 nucleotidyltransferase [Paenibacillus agaridevorans]
MSWKTNLEDTFTKWSKRSSDNEEEKCERALSMIKSAIKEDDQIKNSDISFIPQGSYHNNTNVRLNSDVDICVKLKSTVFYELPEGMKMEDFGMTPSNYTFTDYLKDIERALVKKFGRENVKKGKKAFDVKSNTYRVDADVVACFEHRRYNKDGTYITGTQFYSSNGEKVVNFPEQHYINGVKKNDETRRNYKRVVRIIKRLKQTMVEEGVEGLDNISSFLIECLVWNVPNNQFNNNKYVEDVRNVLTYLYHETKEESKCKEWGEVSDLLYLFHGGRSYSREEVNAFILRAYNHAFS